MVSDHDSSCPYKKLRVTTLEEKDEETGQSSSSNITKNLTAERIYTESMEEGLESSSASSTNAPNILSSPEETNVEEIKQSSATVNTSLSSTGNTDGFESFDDGALTGFLDLDKLKSGHEAEIVGESQETHGAFEGQFDITSMDYPNIHCHQLQDGIKQGLVSHNTSHTRNGSEDGTGEMAERMEIPPNVDSQSSPACTYVHNIQALAENNYMKSRFSSTNTCAVTSEQSRGDNCCESGATTKGDNPTSQMKASVSIEDGQSMLKEIRNIDSEVTGCTGDSSQFGNKISSTGPVPSSSKISDVTRAHIGSSDKSMEMETVTSQKGKDSHSMSVNLEKTDFINMLTLPLTYGHQRTSNSSQCSIKDLLGQPSTFESISDGVKEVSADVRQSGECFKLENHPAENENSINYLPSSILVQIFSNLKVYDLLRRVNRVCKYWYNLCHDPDLWLNVSLVNQHRLTDADLKLLIHRAKCRIRSINMTDCRFITNEGVKAMVLQCHGLQMLKLMRCFYITDAAFNSLLAGQHCSSLKYLYLDGCSYVTDNTVVKIASCCPMLCCLNLNQCAKVTDTGVVALARGCPHLIQLQLDHCLRVSDVGLSKLVHGCVELGCLNLMSCGISDIGVKYLSRLPGLKNIDLSNIPRLMPDSVIFVSKHCKNLQCVNVSLNAVINDDCVAHLATNLPMLKRLYCVSCNISDRGLEELAKHCKTLEALDVGWCQEITDHGVRVISTSCPHLVYLGLIRCDKITIATIEELAIRFPQINFSTFILESRRLLEMARREGYRFEMTAP